MAQGILIGITAGLVSAFISVFPLPLYIVGFGWGPGAALAGALSGALLLLSASGPLAASAYLALFALPATIIVWLLRPQGAPRTSPDDLSPAAPPIDDRRAAGLRAGHVLGLVTLLGGAVAALAVFALGSDLESYRGAIRGWLDEGMASDLEQLTGKALSGPDRDELANITTLTFPTVAALTWMLATLSCAFLAALIARAMRLLQGAWPDFAEMDLHPLMPLAFGAALAALFLPDLGGIIGGGFASAMLAGHVLLGLAMAHGATRGLSQRAFILVAVYLGILLLGRIGFFIVAIFAVAEPLLGLRESARRRRLGRGPI
ncbi:MAG: hypothetical protein GC150_12080 [Rhizobiales bacterium]|nr:hypothetical protein [Hyphomicrobiales bacterium]